MSFEEIIQTDLADLNRMIVMLTRGVERTTLLREFEDDSPVLGTPLTVYLEELKAEGVIEERDGVLQYKPGFSPLALMS